jgi:CMP-N,N'-diacetyllegionaminic acid synthase
MYRDKTILGLIPARGGSKTLKGKNLRPLGDRPLIAWSIAAVTSSTSIDRTIVSSENNEILTVARKFGAETPFVRPSDLASDDTPTIDVVHHALRSINETFDYVVLVQPTSPMVTAGDIDGCVAKCIDLGAPACVSVTPVSKHPFWMYSISDDQRLFPIVENPRTRPSRRQDLPLVFALNGAVFAAKSDWIASQRDFVTAETIAYQMPVERSVDIDTDFDLKIAEALLTSRPVS